MVAFGSLSWIVTNEKIKVRYETVFGIFDLGIRVKELEFEKVRAPFARGDP